MCFEICPFIPAQLSATGPCFHVCFDFLKPLWSIWDNEKPVSREGPRGAEHRERAKVAGGSSARSWGANSPEK